MTDQPTKGPWELAPEGTYPAGEGYKVLGPWFETKAGHKTRCYVAQFMTKADAQFLVRAQHMDELVDAATNMVGYYCPGANPYADEAWNNLRTILAKIDGGK